MDTKTLNKERPAVYVGTYAKYSAGNLDGDWLYIDEYESKEEFIEACKELHKDEEGPELMFQDWDYIGSPLVTEDFISPAIWDFDYCGKLDEYGQILYDFMSLFEPEDLEYFEDHYEGEFDSEESFAEWFAEESGILDEIPERLQCYFNYEAFARDLFSDGYFFINGSVFFAA